MQVAEIDRIAVEYAVFYLQRGSDYDFTCEESIVFSDRIQPLLMKIKEEVKFETDGYTSSAKWFFDLYKHLNHPAPLEIQNYFDWAWANMEQEDACRAQKLKLLLN